jgi:hypothetical protein
MAQTTTITFFRFASFRDRVWAFSMMQFAHRELASVAGCAFYRLMGSGRGIGFNPRPDWSVYSLLQVWENEESARSFLHDADIARRYRDHSSEVFTVFMRNISAKGFWGGLNPFAVDKTESNEGLNLAVITRAVIKKSQLRNFWSFVPASQKPLENADGLLFTKGVGEWPITHMATFSVWRDAESMKNFAYKSSEHREAIERTRKFDWYSEELFARFAVVGTEGIWDGGDPLSRAGD